MSNEKTTEDLLTELADQIALAMNVEAAEDDLIGFEPAAAADGTERYRVSVGHALADAVRYAHETDYTRARDAFALFGGDLAPRLLMSSDALRLVVHETPRGATLTELAEKQGVISVAERLGEWCGRLAATSPVEPLPDNWWDYMTEYEGAADIEILRPVWETLAQGEIRSQTIAHNENALDGFVSNGDLLWAKDFRFAEMKPVGWDLATSGVTLLRQAPGQHDQIGATLALGYARAGDAPPLATGFSAHLPLLILALSV